MASGSLELASELYRQRLGCFAARGEDENGPESSIERAGDISRPASLYAVALGNSGKLLSEGSSRGTERSRMLDELNRALAARASHFCTSTRIGHAAAE